MIPTLRQLAWLVAAVLLFAVVLESALKQRPTKEPVMQQWAQELRNAVERRATPNRFRPNRFMYDLEGHPRFEENGAYAGLADEAVIVAIHERYRLYLNAVPATVKSLRPQDINVQPINLSQANADAIADSIGRIDKRYADALATLPAEQRKFVAGRLALRWALPLAVCYGLASLMPVWWPTLRRRRRVFAPLLLVLGSGILVAGVVEANGLFGGLGAMMIAGGWLMLRPTN